MMNKIKILRKYIFLNILFLPLQYKYEKKKCTKGNILEWFLDAKQIPYDLRKPAFYNLWWRVRVYKHIQCDRGKVFAEYIKIPPINLIK